MDALRQRVEVQVPFAGDDDLPVHHAPLGQPLPQRLHQLGEVPGERLARTAAQFHLVFVAEHDRPEAVPLRLVLHARGIFATDLASIGLTGGITGRSMARL